LVTALPDNLLVKMDRMLMAFGVEGRVPYLDHRVVEFGLSLPEELKAKRRTGKVFLRQWGEQFLPKEHLDRRKSGFGVPVAQWLRGPKLDGIVQALVRNRFIRTWFKAEGILVAGLSPTCRSGREHRALVPQETGSAAPRCHARDARHTNAGRPNTRR
jgi:asparagine synthase (glutamine-hydrolysing)